MDEQAQGISWTKSRTKVVELKHLLALDPHAPHRVKHLQKLLMRELGDPLSLPEQLESLRTDLDRQAAQGNCLGVSSAAGTKYLRTSRWIPPGPLSAARCTVRRRREDFLPVTGSFEKAS